MRYVQLRGGLYFYRRRYPHDLRDHFGGAKFKVESLKTKAAAEAARKATKMAQADDAHWELLRTNEAKLDGAPSPDIRRIATVKLAKMGLKAGVERDPIDDDVLGDFLNSKHGPALQEYRQEHGEWPEWKNYLDPVDNEMIRLTSGKPAQKTLNDALEYYLKEHSRGAQKKFAADKRRSIAHVLRVTGADLPLHDYRRHHAESVRDDLLNRVKTQTVRRHLSDIGAVFQKGILGFDLQVSKHPFMSIPIREEGADERGKETLSPSELKAVATAARSADDSLRHIAAMLINTGARVSEIVALKCSDLMLSGPAPSVHFQPHPEAGHTLKTKGSRRKVPLVGVSLWAAERAVLAANASSTNGWLFPRYVSKGTGGRFAVKSSSAGTALNQWLKRVTGTNKTSHCFRHTLRDRLREAGAPVDIQDVIGGWGSRTVGQGYGEGHSPEFLLRHLQPIAV